MIIMRHIIALLICASLPTHYSAWSSPALSSTHRGGRSVTSNQRVDSKLGAARSSNDVMKREKILRKGEHFDLNRMKGVIEFGAATDLVTNFGNSDAESIGRWISDERGVALSIWDEKMLKDLGSSVYRLQLMSLNFVTIQLSPHVDVRMWTEKEEAKGPVFKLESISFDPNIQVLPGIGISAESLGIQINVAGELRPSKDGNGVTGSIGFISSGILTPPMRLLPEPALKLATLTINRTIMEFAQRSFQRGAISHYRDFCRKEESLNRRKET